jgi:hypothetical protein
MGEAHEEPLSLLFSSPSLFYRVLKGRSPALIEQTRTQLAFVLLFSLRLFSRGKGQRCSARESGERQRRLSKPAGHVHPCRRPRKSSKAHGVVLKGVGL